MSDHLHTYVICRGGLVVTQLLEANDMNVLRTMRSDAPTSPTKHAFAACLCIMAMLIIVLTSGSHLSSAADSFAAASMQQLSSANGPTNPHKSCPFGSHSQSLGTCSSAGFVGLAELATDQVLPADPHVSRFVMTPSSLLAKADGSRLERPPRF